MEAEGDADIRQEMMSENNRQRKRQNNNCQIRRMREGEERMRAEDSSGRCVRDSGIACISNKAKKDPENTN